MDVTAAASGSAPLRLGLPRQGGFWVGWARNKKDVVGEPVNGSVVLNDAGNDTDVVRVVKPDAPRRSACCGPRVPAQRRELRHAPGPDVGDVRVRDGRVEIIDVSGAVRIASAPVFAVDAKGTRRDATLAVQHTGSDWMLTSVDVGE